MLGDLKHLRLGVTQLHGSEGIWEWLLPQLGYRLCDNRARRRSWRRGAQFFSLEQCDAVAMRGEFTPLPFVLELEVRQRKELERLAPELQLRGAKEIDWIHVDRPDGGRLPAIRFKDSDGYLVFIVAEE